MISNIITGDFLRKIRIPEAKISFFERNNLLPLDAKKVIGDYMNFFSDLSYLKEVRFDQYDRVIFKKETSGKEIRYKYDDAGLLIEKELSGGLVTRYVYECNKKQALTYSGGILQAKMAFEYDNKERLIWEAGDGFSNSFEYNNDGQLVKRIHTFNQNDYWDDVRRYKYYPDGNIQEIETSTTRYRYRYNRSKDNFIIEEDYFEICKINF